MAGRSQGKIYPDETYIVEIIRNDHTGVAVSETWNMNNRVHRLGGPAMIERDAETGAVTAEFWLKNNRFHREDGPATISFDPKTGRIKGSAWFIDGQKIKPPRRPRRRPGAIAVPETSRNEPRG